MWNLINNCPAIPGLRAFDQVKKVKKWGWIKRHTFMFIAQKLRITKIPSTQKMIILQSFQIPPFDKLNADWLSGVQSKE